MSESSKKPPAVGPHTCQAIAASVAEHLAAELVAEAARHGGALPAAAIASVVGAVLAQDRVLAPLYRRSFDDCSRARDIALWEQARRHPFDRVLVKRFAHLLPARDGDDGTVAGAILSRRVIPGFHMALKMMIGPVQYERCQHRCQGVVERRRVDHEALDWENIYDDPEARELTNDVLMIMAQYFENFEKRLEWFTIVVNSNLASPTPNAPDETWQLTPPAFRAMMLALYGDLRHALHADKGAVVRRRYGEPALAALVGFLLRLGEIAG